MSDMLQHMALHLHIWRCEQKRLQILTKTIDLPQLFQN